MCGPSAQMQQLGQQEASFSNLLSQNYATNFGAQSKILTNLNQMFTPIAQAGPDQMGFGPQELAALQTGGAEAVAANYAKASRALNVGLATRGGGSEFLPTGAAAALKGQVATAGAQELSQEQLGITEAGYAQGRQNWAQATGGLEALARQYDPTAYAGQATSATGQAFGMADKIQQMKNQEQAGIAGGIASLAMAPFTGGMSLGGLFKGGGTLGGGGANLSSDLGPGFGGGSTGGGYTALMS